MIVGYSTSAPQECNALRFPASAVEMPNKDMLPYLMYKSMREALKDLRLRLNETLDRELSRISDKGASDSVPFM